MAFEFAVQRLQIGDVILVEVPEHDGEVEATVTRDVERGETSVRVTLRIEGSSDLVTREWAIDELVTVVRGP
jgi:hypothetical protein